MMSVFRAIGGRSLVIVTNILLLFSFFGWEYAVLRKLVLPVNAQFD